MITLDSLSYNRTSWKTNMHSIKSKLMRIAGKSTRRDFAW